MNVVFAQGMPFVSSPKIIPADQAFALSVTSLDNTTLKLQWYIAPGTYLYQERLLISQSGKANLKTSLISKEELPSGITHKVDEVADEIIYRDQLVVPISMVKYINDNQIKTIELVVDYQGCSDSGFCYPLVTKKFEIVLSNQIQNIKPVDMELSATPVDKTEVTTPTTTKTETWMKDRSPITILFTFYILGIFLTFTPCVLPMIPILFGIIVGQHHLNTRRAFWLSFSYVLSMAFTYAIAGVIAATLGKNLQAFFQKPAAITTFALLFVVLGLGQLGVFHIGLPQRWQTWLTKHHANQESGSYLGASAMGVLATLIASPCVTAPLIGTLTYISQSGNVWLGGGALFSMGLGMGTLILLMGVLGGTFLPKRGAWMHRVNEAVAIILFGLSIWLLERFLPGPFTLCLWAILCFFTAYLMGTFRKKTGIVGRFGIIVALYGLVLFWGAWMGGGDPLKPMEMDFWNENQTGVNMQTIQSLPALEKQLTDNKQPIMLVFHADWCISCKQFEEDVLANPTVKEAIKGFKLINADITPFNEDNQVLMKKFGIIGPPAVLFFNKNGIELTKHRINGEIDVELFLTHLQTLKSEMSP